jgi:hypothetical protein
MSAARTPAKVKRSTSTGSAARKFNSLCGIGFPAIFVGEKV